MVQFEGISLHFIKLRYASYHALGRAGSVDIKHGRRSYFQSTPLENGFRLGTPQSYTYQAIY
jgi:hypothetical protein